MKKIFTLFLALGSVALHAQFTSGNLVISYNTGNTNAATYRAGFLQEFTTSGNPVGTALALNRTIDDARAAHEGHLCLTSDGKYITLVARNSTSGETRTNARKNPLSLIGVNKQKVIGTTEVASTDGAWAAFDGESVRCGASTNGTAFYVATGGSGLTKGTRQMAFGDNTTSTQYVNQQTRYAGVWGGEVLTVSQDNPGKFTINGVDTVLETGGSFDGLCAAVGFDLDASRTGIDLVYIANRNSGILKFYFDGSSWKYAGISNAPVLNGYMALTGRIEGGKPTLYGIKIDPNAPGQNSSLYQIIDNAAKNVDWNSGGVNNATHTLLATSDAGTQQTFRGIAFAPTVDAPALSTSKFDLNNKSGLKIYPTNAKDIITISNDNNDLSISVYNIVGQKVLSSKSQNDIKLNVSGLKSGIYLVRSASGLSGRFIKE